MMHDGPILDADEYAVTPLWSPRLDAAHPRAGQYLGLRLTLRDPLVHRVVVEILDGGKESFRAAGTVIDELGDRSYVDTSARIVHVFADGRLGFTTGMGETFSGELDGRRFVFNQNRTDIVGEWTGTLVRAEGSATWRVASLGRPGTLGRGDDARITAGSLLADAELNFASALSAGNDDSDITASAEGALASLDEVLRLDPAIPRALALRGRASACLERWDAGEADLRAALALEEEPSAREWLCELLVRRGVLDEALDEARRLDDPHADCLARVHQLRNETAACLDAYTRCIATSPEPLRVEGALYARALVAIAAREYERALRDLEQCAASLGAAPPERPACSDEDIRRARVQNGVNVVRGRCLFDLGRYNEAIASWKLVEGNVQAKAWIAEAEAKRALFARRPPRLSLDDD
jgi:hypothetical protein